MAYIVIDMNGEKTSYKFATRSEADSFFKQEIIEYMEHGFFLSYVLGKPLGEVKLFGDIYDILNDIKENSEWKFIKVPGHGKFIVRDFQQMMTGLNMVGLKNATAHVSRGKPEARSVDELFMLIGCYACK